MVRSTVLRSLYASRSNRGAARPGGALHDPVAPLVLLLGDRRPDAALTQVVAIGPARVGLIGQGSPGPGPGPASPEAGDTDAFQQRLELQGVTALTCRELETHDRLGRVGGPMHLGGPTPA